MTTTVYALVRTHAAEGNSVVETGSDYAALTAKADRLNREACEAASEAGAGIFPWHQVITAGWQPGPDDDGGSAALDADSPYFPGELEA